MTIPTITGALEWDGAPGTSGTVAVVGLGKIGLPLAAQYASRGWHVIGVDVMPEVVAIVAEGGSHIAEEPGIAELLAAAHEQGRLAATMDHAAAAAAADVVVLAVPVMLDANRTPDFSWMDAATDALAAGLRPGALVVYETTLPVGTTRQRYGPRLERGSGLPLGASGFRLAFSPERVYSGRILADLQRYPKLVGGVDQDSTARAVSFYESAIGAEVWDLGSAEAAEFAKLAETTYRDVNIALANEFARVAERVGVDILDVIRGANSQPYSHIHQPGIGVGGHCIPVYPHLLLATEPGLTLVRSAREVNDAQVHRALDVIEQVVGPLSGRTMLVLGLTYREGVNEMAYSRALALIEALRERGSDVEAYDPLLGDERVAGYGARPYRWGERSDAVAIITQTGDPTWDQLDPALFPHLAVVLDGRNSLRLTLDRWPPGVSVIGIGRRPAR